MHVHRWQELWLEEDEVHPDDAAESPSAPDGYEPDPGPWGAWHPFSWSPDERATGWRRCLLRLPVARQIDIPATPPPTRRARAKAGSRAAE